MTRIPTNAPSTPSVPPRAAGLDAARFLAAAAVVWIHVPRSGEHWWAASTSLSRFAVPMFAMAAGYALVGSLGARPEGVGAAIRRRLHRLYVPFLGWSAIYLALRLAKRSGDIQWSVPSLLMAGPAQQLWFLPFLFLASVPVVLAWPLLADRRGARRFAACLALSAGGAIGVVEAITGLRDPFGGVGADGWRAAANLSYQALPAFLWGLGLALLAGRSLGAVALSRWAGWAGLLAAGAATALAWREDPILPRSSAMECLAGAGAFAAALAWRGALAERLAGLGGLAYGVYLSHIVFLQAAFMACDRLEIAASLGRDLVIFALAVGASAALTAALRAWRPTRWLAP